MREKFAIGVSILVFVALYFGLDALANILGIPTYIDFGETITVTRGGGRSSYDEEIDGQTTDVGLYILIASAMLAWRAFHWVVSGKPGGNLKREHRITWFHWFTGLTVYVVITTTIWHIDIPAILQRLLVLGVGVGIAVFFYKKHQKAIYEARDQ